MEIKQSIYPHTPTIDDYNSPEWYAGMTKKALQYKGKGKRYDRYHIDQLIADLQKA